METVEIITATYQEINTAIPAACSSPAGAFGPADLEEPPGCFFPLGFRFLGASSLFVAHRMDFLLKARPMAGPAGI